MIKIEKHLDLLEDVFKTYGITSLQRKAHFLAQIGHESSSLRILEENFNYSITALLAKFSRARISRDDCYTYGRRQGKKADQVALANILYGGDWGRRNLGNTEPNDGWNYRGRGALQCTGRANYLNYSKVTGIDFIKNPDLMLDLRNGLHFAGWFWELNGCNPLADLDALAKITKVINGGWNGLRERKLELDKYLTYYNSL